MQNLEVSILHTLSLLLTALPPLDLDTIDGFANQIDDEPERGSTRSMPS